jgi:pantoate--beta-alanine ligase
MVRDLHVRVRMVICPIVRDADGLALSSRNVYLSAADREEAVRLPRAIRRAEGAILEGERDGDRIRSLLREGLRSARPDVRADYADLVHTETLVSLGRLETHGVLLACLRVGKVRLLDNAIVAPPGTPAWEA